MRYRRLPQRGCLWFLNVAQLAVYFGCLCAAAWLILSGFDALAGPAKCGNGEVDPGENCANCPEDVMCGFCESCVLEQCVPQPFCTCGDGIPGPGETCANCPQDVVCPDDKACVEGRCVLKCVSAVSPMEVIFLFDTSGSMLDEVADLCVSLLSIQAELEAFGLDVSIEVWGIAPGISIPCATGFADQYGPLHNESWAPAVTLVSANYPWKTNARILVPISDEGPYQGNPCETPEDHASIAEAVLVANEFNVFVSPIMGQPWQPNTERCIQSLGRELAIGTGGTWYAIQGLEMQDVVVELIQATLCGCPGDLDGDGTVGIKDLLALLAGWYDGSGDIDGDGDTDQIDLLFLLEGWGECG